MYSNLSQSHVAGLPSWFYPSKITHCQPKKTQRQKKKTEMFTFIYNAFARYVGQEFEASKKLGPKGKAFHVCNSRGQLGHLRRELVNVLWPLQDSILKWWVKLNLNPTLFKLFLKKTDTILLSRHNDNFFLCPTLMTCWLIHFHICFTELNIYRLSFFHHTVRSQHCWSLQYAGCMSNMNLVYGLALREFSVAQVYRAPTWCLGGHRFESCRGLKFFSSHARDMLINSFSHLFYQPLKLPIVILSPHSTTSTLLILAVCRMCIKYECSIWPHSLWVLRSTSG